jgi:hypothetical protein
MLFECNLKKLKQKHNKEKDGVDGIGGGNAVLFIFQAIALMA